jgi:uncharacterized protein involved in exopolysaccharide biosynthesis
MNDNVDILQALKRNRGIVIACAVLLGAAGFGISEVMPPVYEATARIEIRRPAQRTAWSEQALGASSAQVENLNLFTCAELIKRRALLTRLAEELENRGAWVATARMATDRGGPLAWLGVAPAQAGSRPAAGSGPLSASPPPTIDACVIELGSMIAVHPVRDTRLVDVVVQCNAPEVARTIADRLATLFVEDERRRSSAADTAGLGMLEQELAEARERMQTHGAGARGLTPGGDELLNGRRARLTQAMAQLDGERQRAADAQRDAGLRLSKLQRYASAPDTALWEESGNASIDALHRELLACSRRLAAARAIYRPLHPKLAALDSEYAELRALERRSLPAVARELRGLVSYEAAHGARLEAAMADSERALGGIQARAASIGGVVALAQSDRDLEGRLLDRIRDRMLEAPLDAPPVDRVDAAIVDPDPVRPRRGLNVLVGTFAGMLLGMGVALVRKPARVLERPEQIESELELPVLGVLPEQLGGVRS